MLSVNSASADLVAVAARCLAIREARARQPFCVHGKAIAVLRCTKSGKLRHIPIVNPSNDEPASAFAPSQSRLLSTFGCGYTLTRISEIKGRGERASKISEHASVHSLLKRNGKTID
ncbi:hypothetical protein [Paraburkholderia strydomiana]|uniref:hypothetical protein n=1 Tax=Paraburkholderia strydomiana TaxID=1245417 RepID=UPI001BED1EB9|nr:hypothetical protein [Paraburkholderia strydomiana]MBT2793598.1 hypothetical protein [Paraburkholderia strydomiana]